MKLRKISALLFASLMCILMLTVNVSAATEEKGISLDESTITISEGSTRTLKATVTGYKSCTVTWNTSNQSVATIAKGGVVTAKKAGTAYITATIKGTSYSAVCRVRVTSSTPLTYTSAQGAVLPDPAAYFGCTASKSAEERLPAEQGDGYSFGVSLDMNKNGLCVVDYISLIMNKYNFTNPSTLGGKDEENQTETLFGTLTYNGNKNITDVRVLDQADPADAFIGILYDYKNSEITLWIYFSKDIKVADYGDRGDWQSKLSGNSSSGSSGSSRSGSSNSNSSSSGSGSSGSGSSGSSSSGSGSFGGSSSSSRNSSRATITCVKCHGSGSVSCSNCSGRGYKEKTKSTPNYSGKKGGAKSYTVKENCYKCHGSGSTTCTRCGGSGRT